MLVEVLPDAAAVGRRAADLVEDLVRSTPAPVLGLATGATPLPLYRELAHRHRDEGLSFATTQAFLLDEYLGLDAEDPRSFHSMIQLDLLAHLDVPPAAVDGPDGAAADRVAECRRYEAAIATTGGIELQVLGIGRNGHVAFNEPGSPLDSRTRVVTLTEKTRTANAAALGADPDEVPTHGLTQGLGTILDARRLLLLATGAAKAGPLAAALRGPVTTVVPASIVQRHPDAIVLVDEAAATRPGAPQPG